MTRTFELNATSDREETTIDLGSTAAKTVFEQLARPVEDVGDIRATGPTQNPTHMGGQFVGIDQDRNA